MSKPLHFRLPSGRVLLLKVPLTDEELQCVKENPEALEMIADEIERRTSRSISSDTPAGRRLRRRHGLS